MTWKRTPAMALAALVVAALLALGAAGLYFGRDHEGAQSANVRTLLGSRLSARAAAPVPSATQSTITSTWTATALACNTRYTVVSLAIAPSGSVTDQGSVAQTTSACAVTPPPAPPPPPSPPPATYLFNDEFNTGPGTAPDVAKWTVNDNNDTSSSVASTSYKAANAYTDGQGNLVLRVSKGTRGRAYDGALLATFTYGSGWPPTGVKAAIAPPAHFEARMKMPKGAGVWPAFWPLGTNAAPPVLEIDIAELRMFQPRIDTFHLHNVTEQNGQKDVGVDTSLAFHVYAADYYADHVDFFFDGSKIGTLPIPPTTHQAMGPVLWNIVGVPSEWGGEGGPPPNSALPADLLVDYVRVSRLP